MEEKIAALRAELEADLAAVHNKDELSAFWQKYLSKNGSVTGLTKSLRDVPKEERPAAGKTINEFKVWVEGQYQAASADSSLPSHPETAFPRGRTQKGRACRPQQGRSRGYHPAWHPPRHRRTASYHPDQE